MATIPLKDITFPGLDNTYTIPEIDNTLSTAGKAADAKKTGDEILALQEDLNELNSNFADMESDGVVPSAEQILTDKGVTDSAPYHYRKTGGDGADRLYDQIVGGTVCFNQIYNVSNSGTRFGITVDVTSGSVAITGTSTEPGSGPTFSWTSFKVTNGHKVIIQKDFALPTGDFIFDQYNGVSSQDVTNRVVNVTSGYLIPQLQIANSGVTYNITGHLSVFDLTQMFGSAVADYIYNLDQSHAGDGVAFFKSLFPNDYYPYDSGTLKSVEGLSEHKTVGFNAWDEQWEVGGYAGSTGAAWDTNTRIRSKTTNYISVLPNTTYYVNMPSGTNMYLDIMFYNAGKTFISSTSSNAGTTFTTPSDARFMRFATAVNYGTTYNHDICINLSDPAKNGTYEPYKAHSYPLDDSLTLRGIPKLVDGKMCFDGDIYDADGTVTRKYGIVDLEALNWTYSTVRQFFYVNLTGIKKPSALLAAIYTNVGVKTDSAMADEPSMTIGQTSNSEEIKIRNTNYTDAATFKAAMSGVMLVYELATPTTEEADPYQHLQQCDPNGTEEYVSTGIVPIGHNTQYPENLKAKIEGLPWNFASLIAPTESTFTATRNYTTGALFIVDNVLYKATSNIANGGTITPNTNCTATTLAEIISALA